MQLLTLAMVVSLAILPISRPKHPRVSTLSRGPELIEITKDPSYPAALAQAKKHFAGKRRVVVLPFIVTGVAEELAPISFQAELIADLQHIPDVVVVDLLTLRHVSPETARGADLKSATQIGQKLAADIVVFGAADQTGDKLKATAQAVDLRGRTKPTVIAVEGSPADFFKLTNDITQHLLAEWRLKPDETQRKSMVASPTSVPSARANCDRALASFLEWNTATEQPNARLLQDAKAHAQKAIEADPYYLRTYLIAASIAEALNDQDKAKESLIDGRNHYRPTGSQDQRTVLEFEADYARYVDDDWLKAQITHTEILKLCPNDPLALCRGIDAFCAAQKPSKLAADTRKRLADYAARIQIAHPRFPIASNQSN